MLLVAVIVLVMPPVLFSLLPYVSELTAATGEKRAIGTGCIAGRRMGLISMSEHCENDERLCAGW